MIEQEQRIAIAEACGFERNPQWLPRDDYPAEFAKGNDNCYLAYNTVDELPNYPQDLNAMHEAEKMIEGCSNWNRYTDELGKLCGYKPNIHNLRSFVNIIVSATATQRAEAFLKTIGKWKD